VSDLCDQITKEREARRKRDQKIVAAWDAGQSYAAIGRAFRMSGDNVKDRIERFHRNKRIHESIGPFVKLTPENVAPSPWGGADDGREGCRCLSKKRAF